jgi:hypothetical protein
MDQMRSPGCVGLHLLRVQSDRVAGTAGDARIMREPGRSAVTGFVYGTTAGMIRSCRLRLSAAWLPDELRHAGREDFDADHVAHPL